METELKLKENLSENPSEALLKQICGINYELNETYNKKTEFAMFRHASTEVEKSQYNCLQDGKQKEVT